MSEPFQILTSKTVTLSQANIDTDQIIPARFLTTTSREGLGKAAFHDWRYEADGSEKPEAILNRLNVEIRKAAQDPEAKTVWAGQGADFPNVTGAQFGKLIHDEIRKWADVVKASGAKLE